MKSVIFYGSGVMPDGNASAQRIMSLAQCFYRLGYNCYSINYYYGNSNEAKQYSKEYNHVKCYYSKYPNTITEWIQEIFEQKHYRNIIENIKGEKIIYIYGGQFIKNIKLVRYAKKNNIRLVMDIEEYDDYKFSLNPANIIRQIDSFFSMRVLYPRVKNLVLISTYLRDLYKKSTNNTVVFPTTINVVEQQDTDIDIIVNYGEKIKLIFAGNIGHNFLKERLDIVLNSLLKLDLLNNISLDIVGVSKEELLQYYTEEQLAKFNIYGKVDNKKCKDLIAKADFSLIPRTRTRKSLAGFPTKLSESFMQGTPVIATDTSDIKDYIVDGKNGYLLPECTEEEFVKIFEKISKLTIDERYQMKRNAFDMNKLVAENFENDLIAFLNNMK